MPITLPGDESLTPPGELPFIQYLNVSQAIGLDFRPYADQTLELRNYMLGHEPVQQGKVFGHLLGTDDRIVGAWLSVENMTPGIRPLNTKLDDLVPRRRSRSIGLRATDSQTRGWSFDSCRSTLADQKVCSPALAPRPPIRLYGFPLFAQDLREALWQ